MTLHLDLIYLILKVLIAVTVLFALFIVSEHFKAMRNLDRMIAEGAVQVPGARRFYVGNILDFLDREKQAKDK